MGTPIEQNTGEGYIEHAGLKSVNELQRLKTLRNLGLVIFTIIAAYMSRNFMPTSFLTNLVSPETASAASSSKPSIVDFEATYCGDHVEATATVIDDNLATVSFWVKQGDSQKTVCPPTLIDPVRNPGPSQEITFNSCPVDKGLITNGQIGVTALDADGQQASKTTPVLYKLFLPFISRFKPK
jgi:hypothetical protein